MKACLPKNQCTVPENTKLLQGEIRFTKVKQRQLNKFNNLLNKKEGNITGVLSLNSSHNLVSSQAGAHLPPMEGSNSQAGRHSPSLRGRRQSISFPGRQLISSPFPGRCSPSPRRRKQFISFSGRQLPVHSQAGAHLPPGEGSSLVASQASQTGRHSPSL